MFIFLANQHHEGQARPEPITTILSKTEVWTMNRVDIFNVQIPHLFNVSKKFRGAVIHRGHFSPSYRHCYPGNLGKADCRIQILCLSTFLLTLHKIRKVHFINLSAEARARVLNFCAINGSTMSIHLPTY